MAIETIQIEMTCKKCGNGIQLEQVDVGQYQVIPCRSCIRNKVIKVLEKKEAEFLATYTEVKEEVIAEIQN